MPPALAANPAFHRLRRLTYTLLISVTVIGGVVLSAQPSAAQCTCGLSGFGASSLDPLGPGVGPLVEGPDGGFYGVAPSGGPFQSGVIYRITELGTIEVMVSFNGTNGAKPVGGLTRAGDGTLYRVARGGGERGMGTVFHYAYGTSVNVLHHFNNGRLPRTAEPYSKQEILDAAPGYPDSPPIEGPDGSLYEVTEYSGNVQSRVFYRLRRNGEFRGLYHFDGSQGRIPHMLATEAKGRFMGRPGSARRETPTAGSGSDPFGGRVG